jgi:hypothetical protein
VILFDEPEPDFDDRRHTREAEEAYHDWLSHLDYPEWTAEQITEGKHMAYDLGDALLRAGFTEEDAEAMVNKYIRQINTGSFAAYANRIAAANLRRIS